MHLAVQVATPSILPPNGKPVAGFFRLTFPARRDLADAAKGIVYAGFHSLSHEAVEGPILEFSTLGASVPKHARLIMLLPPAP